MQSLLLIVQVTKIAMVLARSAFIQVPIVPIVNSFHIMVNAKTKLDPTVFYDYTTNTTGRIAKKNVLQILGVLHSPMKATMVLAITVIYFPEDHTYLE